MRPSFRIFTADVKLCSRSVVQLWLLMFLACGISFAQTTSPVAFAIADQFDSVHTEKELLGVVGIVIGSDGVGSAYNEAWAMAIEDTLTNRWDVPSFRFIPVADLSSVPVAMRDTVKGGFRHDPSTRVLLDWSGYFSKVYEFKGGVCNILVFDRAGHCAFRTSGKEVNVALVRKICDRVMEEGN